MQVLMSCRFLCAVELVALAYRFCTSFLLFQADFSESSILYFQEVQFVKKQCFV